MTFIVAEPVFSIVVVTCNLDDIYDLILDISNLLRIVASRIDSCCSETCIEPEDLTETLGRIEYRTS